MLFRPYMLSDPGFNEGVLEFSLYYDLLERLVRVPDGTLREAAAKIAAGIALAVAAGATPEGEERLREIRTSVAAVAGLPADPETLLDPRWRSTRGRCRWNSASGTSRGRSRRCRSRTFA